MSRTFVTPEEALVILREILDHGVLELHETSDSFEEVYHGEIQVKFAGNLLRFMLDRGELSNLDWIKTSDGREGEFDSWWATGMNPVDRLTPYELSRFINILETAGAVE